MPDGCTPIIAADADGVRPPSRLRGRRSAELLFRQKVISLAQEEAQAHAAGERARSTRKPGFRIRPRHSIRIVYHSRYLTALSRLRQNLLVVVVRRARTPAGKQVRPAGR